MGRSISLKARIQCPNIKNRLPALEDFAEWYNQLVLRAELADYVPVCGLYEYPPILVKLCGTTSSKHSTAVLKRQGTSTLLSRC